MSLETKDAFLALPFLGSAIAVSWEVGSFIPIGLGAFGLFSLAEHLSFAMAALPLGLTFAALLPVIMSAARTAIRQVARAKIERRPTTSAQIRAGIAAGVVLFVVLGIGIAAFGAYAKSAMMLILSFVTFAIALTLALHPPSIMQSSRQMLVAGAAFALLFAMAAGTDQTLLLLRDPEQVAVNATIGDTSREVVLLRSGERGLLLYEIGTRRFLFEKWANVKELDWARQPLGGAR
jgi:hypothetical protein